MTNGLNTSHGPLSTVQSAVLWAEQIASDYSHLAAGWKAEVKRERRQTGIWFCVSCVLVATNILIYVAMR